MENQTKDPVINVAVIDDEAALRDSLRHWLNHNAGFQCIGSWASVEEALETIAWKKPEVLLLDLHLAGDPSLRHIPVLKEKAPNTEIVMLTSEEDYYWVKEALQLGARGYLLKKRAAETLGSSLRDVLRGGSPLSSEISHKMISEHIVPAGQSAGLEELTQRERMVLDKLAEGLVYKEIAAACDISLETVRTHSRRILRKLGVSTKTEAVLKYLKLTRRS